MRDLRHLIDPQTAHTWWPTAALHGEVSQELPNPSQFTDLVQSVTEDQVAEAILCNPDPEQHLAVELVALEKDGVPASHRQDDPEHGQRAHEREGAEHVEEEQPVVPLHAPET